MTICTTYAHENSIFENKVFDKTNQYPYAYFKGSIALLLHVYMLSLYYYRSII